LGLSEDFTALEKPVWYAAALRLAVVMGLVGDVRREGEGPRPAAS
jgi:hypothetical protein